MMAAWTLTWVKMAYSLLTATPSCGEDVDYAIGTHDNTGKQHRLQFKDMTGERMNFGDALFMLAETAGMGSIQSFSPWFPQSKERAVRQHALATCSSSFDPMRSLALLRGELRRGLVRFGFVAVCENSVQVNLQITLLALSRSVHRWSNFEKRAFMSITVCLVLSVLRLVSVMGLLRFAAEVLKAIAKFEEQEGNNIDLEAEGMAGSLSVQTTPSSSWHLHQPGWTLESEKKLVGRYVMCIKLFAAGFTVLLVYAMVKLAAAYICEDSLFNVLGGCVHLPDDIVNPHVVPEGSFAKHSHP
jgi:hypothetical protein